MTKCINIPSKADQNGVASRGRATSVIWRSSDKISATRYTSSHEQKTRYCESCITSIVAGKGFASSRSSAEAEGKDQFALLKGMWSGCGKDLSKAIRLSDCPNWPQRGAEKTKSFRVPTRLPLRRCPCTLVSCAVLHHRTILSKGKLLIALHSP